MTGVRLAAIGLGALSLVALASSARADAGQAAPTDPENLADLSLEELAQVEITSVSRRPESLSHAASAVFVITQDDIRRSGAPSLPEVLRLAPNLQVQRIGASDYAISARGFNGYETANKLLVLIDGRSVYTTLYSGVLWDAQGLPLEDIERIEVISGPGGALYGSNAVNGVINIITRSAQDTVGLAFAAGVGDQDKTLSLRQGGQWSAGAWRVWLTGFQRAEMRGETPGLPSDEAEGVRAGFRTDFAYGPNRFMVSGDLYDHAVANDTDLSGGFLKAGWAREFARGDRLNVDVYADGTVRELPGARETVDTWDIEFQHTLAPWGRHSVVWGAGHRWVANEMNVDPGGLAFLAPPRRDITLGNLFIQDQIDLGGGVALTLGAKVEDSSFTGLEFLPSVRLAWARPGGDLLWGAVSRAVRTPNRIDRDFHVPGFILAGDFQSETVVAYEAGYRAAPRPDLSFSISAFFNDYDDLRTVDPDPLTVLPFSFANGGQGQTWGVEAWGSYAPTPDWRLNAGLATLHKDFGIKPGFTDISNLASIGFDPEYSAFISSQVDIGDRLEVDMRIRAVDDLEGSDVDGYVDADLRIGWRLTERAELSLSGTNLLTDERVETADTGRRRLIGRDVFLGLRYGF